MTDRPTPTCPYCGDEMTATIKRDFGKMFRAWFQCGIQCQVHTPVCAGYSDQDEAEEAAYAAAMRRADPVARTIMKRLTKRDANGAAHRYGCRNVCAYCRNCDCDDMGEMVERLAAYEDSGLSPERAAELGKADAEGRVVIKGEDDGGQSSDSRN